MDMFGLTFFRRFSSSTFGRISTRITRKRSFKHNFFLWKLYCLLKTLLKEKIKNITKNYKRFTANTDRVGLQLNVIRDEMRSKIDGEKRDSRISNYKGRTMGVRKTCFFPPPRCIIGETSGSLALLWCVSIQCGWTYFYRYEIFFLLDMISY